MVVQRIRERIRDQNWFALLLEILVVVVGIYLALQADAWMLAKKDRVLEAEYLERLLADLEDSIVAQAKQLESFDADIAAIDYIARVQRTGSFEDVDEALLIQGLNSLHWVAPPATNMVTIRELQSTGNISLIQEVSVRTAIGEFERSYAALEHDARLIMGLMAASAPEVMTWSFMEPNVAGEHRSMSTEDDYSFGYVNRYDADRMLANPDAAKITSWISGWSKYQGAVMVDHHEDTIEFRDLLKVKLERSVE